MRGGTPHPLLYFYFIFIFFEVHIYTKWDLDCLFVHRVIKIFLLLQEENNNNNFKNSNSNNNNNNKIQVYKQGQ